MTFSVAKNTQLNNSYDYLSDAHKPNRQPCDPFPTSSSKGVLQNYFLIIK